VVAFKPTIVIGDKAPVTTMPSGTLVITYDIAPGQSVKATDTLVESRLASVRNLVCPKRVIVLLRLLLLLLLLLRMLLMMLLDVSGRRRGGAVLLHHLTLQRRDLTNPNPNPNRAHDRREESPLFSG
jgi:hypothetical protein